MLKAFVIDDEPIAVDVVKTLAAKVPFIELTGCYTNAFEAMEPLRREKPDLLFLDIRMPDISGIDFLKALPDPPLVIMTTAYSEHAVQSFELDVIDYLLKPFSQARFLKACNKAMEQHALRAKGPMASPASLFIKSGYEQVKIALDELLYVESSGNYVRFVSKGQVLLSRMTMAEVAELLPISFIRIHRSYFVARTHVTKADKNNVWVGNTGLPVGPGYTQEVERITGRW